MPLLYDPSGFEDRCGFNILTKFFFGGQQDDNVWHYGKIKPLDIIILTTQIIHQRLIATKILSGSKMIVDHTTIGRGIEFDPFVIFIRMFSNYYQIKCGLPMEWDAIPLQDSPKSMCVGNTQVAVLYGGRRDVAETTFTLANNHWVMYSKFRSVSKVERKIRIEFILNTFIQMATSFGDRDFKNVFDLTQVGKLVNRYFDFQTRRAYGAKEVMQHIFSTYKLVRMILNRSVDEIDINEDTQQLVAYLFLRAAVNYNQAGGMAYNVQEPYTYNMDEEYRNIVRSGMSEKLTTVFKKTLGLIPSGCTNFTSLNPTHNRFYANPLINLNQVDFMLALYKRVTGYKTLLEKSKLLEENPSFHTVVIFLKERNRVLADPKLFNPNKNLSSYLVDPKKIFIDIYTQVGLGESFFITAGNSYGRLGHVKLLLSAWIHTLKKFKVINNHDIVQRYIEPENELTKMNDTSFLKAFQEISTIKINPDLDPEVISRIPYRDLLAENLRMAGLFEFARILGPSESSLRTVVSKSHLRMSIQNAIMLVLDKNDILDF